MLPTRSLTTLTLLLTLAAGAPAQQCPGPADAHGDPLPPGAAARLGTVRLRHATRVFGAAFAPDGKSVVAGDFYGGVHVWDAATGRERRRLYATDPLFHGLALSPDGRTLAVNLGDLRVRLCDPTTGRELGILPELNERYGRLVFSPDGSKLATGKLSSWSINVWDVATRRLEREVRFPEKVGTVTFSADSTQLVGVAESGDPIAVVLADGTLAGPPPRAKGKDVLDAIFAPNGGPKAVWGYADGSVRLFDPAGVTELRRLPLDPGVRPDSPWGWRSSLRLGFAPDGRTLAVFRNVSRTELCHVELWDVRTGTRRHTLDTGPSHKPTYLLFSPDGRTLATAGGDLWTGDNVVRLWDVATGTEKLTVPGHHERVNSVAVSPDAAAVATAGGDGAVHLWERATGRHVARLGDVEGRRPDVHFAADGRRVVWWGWHALQVWDARAAAVVSRLELDGQYAYWRAASADGTTAVAHDSNAVRFYDLATGKVTRAFEGLQYPVALSPAGDRLALTDGTVLTTADGVKRFDFGATAFRNPSVRFSGDGRRLVAAVQDANLYKLAVSEPPAYEVAIVDAVEGRQMWRFGRDPTKYVPIEAVGMSADGKTAVTARLLRDGSYQRLVTLWETETGKERGHFVGHVSAVNSIAWGGRYVVTASGDTTALVWDTARAQTRSPVARRLTTAARVAALAGDDAEAAYAAIRALADTPAETVAHLAALDELYTRPAADDVRRWVRELDSPAFADRDRAMRSLEAVLDEAEAELRAELARTPSAEVRDRVGTLLQKRSRGPTGREVQRYRAVETLEVIAAEGGTGSRTAALGVLRKLATSFPNARTAKDAAAAVARLAAGS